MDRCAVCGDDRMGPVKGIYPDSHGRPVAVAYDCLCGNSRAIEWAATDDSTRAEALLAERARMAQDGLL